MTPLLGRLRRRLWPPRRRPVILMYHRVAAPRVDPWDLAVEPERFAAQLEVLRATRRPFAMSEFVDRARRGRLPDDAVAVTFDDGYADTLTQARPRLARAGVPATLFLATAFVGQRVEYWWDELARGLLVDAEARPDGGRDPWRADGPPKTERQAMYLARWQALRALSAAARDAELARVRASLRLAPPREEDLPLTAGEVAVLAADPLFEIGGHTSGHPVLTMLDAAARRREIAEGRDACARLVGRAPVGFAYPHGSHDADARAAVAECGFGWACTTESRPVAQPVADDYALPRLAVRDWDAAAFERALWMATA
jgi:peptidoglycan/xylan/chitin deacetylase (PgdA/CDA1 family)